MPKSYSSFDDEQSGVDGPAETEHSSYAIKRWNSEDQGRPQEEASSTPRSPLWSRRAQSKARFVDEGSSLLDNADHTKTYQTRDISTPGTPRTLRTPGIRRQHSYNASSVRHVRVDTSGSTGFGFSNRLVNALIRERSSNMEASGMVLYMNDPWRLLTDHGHTQIQTYRTRGIPSTSTIGCGTTSLRV